MSKQRYAAIDLGTNTFHILIAQKTSTGKFEKVYQRREYVYLGRDGVSHINDESYAKGMETIGEFATQLINFGVADYKMTGTETFRHADNGAMFIKEVKEKFSLDIDIIDGLKEAEYIYKGVLAYLAPPSGKYLIMDIGGGSVEFIHFDVNEMLYSESFPIGISVLYNQFQNSDPLNAKSIQETQTWLSEKLTKLSEYLENKQVDALVGSAGSFEVISTILESSLGKEIDEKFSRGDYKSVYDEILPLNMEQRIAHPGIPKERAVLIPIAMVLIDHILNTFDIQDVLLSPYALKEGVISDFVS